MNLICEWQQEKYGRTGEHLRTTCPKKPAYPFPLIKIPMKKFTDSIYTSVDSTTVHKRKVADYITSKQKLKKLPSPCWSVNWNAFTSLRVSSTSLPTGKSLIVTFNKKKSFDQQNNIKQLCHLLITVITTATQHSMWLSKLNLPSY